MDTHKKSQCCSIYILFIALAVNVTKNVVSNSRFESLNKQVVLVSYYHWTVIQDIDAPHFN